MRRNEYLSPTNSGTFSIKLSISKNKSNTSIKSYQKDSFKNTFNLSNINNFCIYSNKTKNSKLENAFAKKKIINKILKASLSEKFKPLKPGIYDGFNTNEYLFSNSIIKNNSNTCITKDRNEKEVKEIFPIINFSRPNLCDKVKENENNFNLFNSNTNNNNVEMSKNNFLDNKNGDLIINEGKNDINSGFENNEENIIYKKLNNFMVVNRNKKFKKTSFSIRDAKLKNHTPFGSSKILVFDRKGLENCSNANINLLFDKFAFNSNNSSGNNSIMHNSLSKKNEHKNINLKFFNNNNCNNGSKNYLFNNVNSNIINHVNSCSKNKNPNQNAITNFLYNNKENRNKNMVKLKEKDIDKKSEENNDSFLDELAVILSGVESTNNKDLKLKRQNKKEDFDNFDDFREKNKKNLSCKKFDFEENKINFFNNNDYNSEINNKRLICHRNDKVKVKKIFFKRPGTSYGSRDDKKNSVNKSTNKIES